MQIGWPIAIRPAVEHGSGQKKLFFHLLDLATVNSYILLSSWGGKKISHRDFQLTRIREMLAWAGHKPRPSIPVGRPAPAFTKIGRLETRHNKHWPRRNLTKLWHMYSARGVTRMVTFQFVKCDVVLCADQNCFVDYHTKNNLYIFSSILCVNIWSLDHKVSKRT
jgi:hypothetical protein